MRSPNEGSNGGNKQNIRCNSNVGMFKLADETQMGSLNSLMVSFESKTKAGNNNVGEVDDESGMNIILNH